MVEGSAREQLKEQLKASPTFKARATTRDVVQPVVRQPRNVRSCEDRHAWQGYYSRYASCLSLATGGAEGQDQDCAAGQGPNLTAHSI